MGVPRRRPPIGRLLRPVVGFVAAAAVWQAAATTLGIAPFILPAPVEVVDAFARHGPYLLAQAWITLVHTATGFAVAGAAGTVAAAALASSTWVREATLPLLVAIQNTPKVAFAPLLVVQLGFGHTSKITLVVLLCFFPVLVATLAGLTATPAEAVELARSLTASPLRVFTKIRLRYALPQVFTGLKVAASLALIGAVVAQIATPDTGLGAVIVRSGQSADTALAFAAILLLAAIGTGMFYAIALAQRFTVPWARHVTA